MYITPPPRLVHRFTIDILYVGISAASNIRARVITILIIIITRHEMMMMMMIHARVYAAYSVL